MEEPGRLQSIGCLVRHDWTISLSLSCIGEGNGNLCSCLENPRDCEAWWVAVYGVVQNWTGLTQLSSSSNHLKVTKLVIYLLILKMCHNVILYWEFKKKKKLKSLHVHVSILKLCNHSNLMLSRPLQGLKISPQQKIWILKRDYFPAKKWM